ncbi:hypothetical protein TVAG_444810 [Trichomonas vaginalis G3]|uniref:Uncharacterized protein n=1 Tax=Trichomonas vaginalis (strain ATCC PRA-98 / G3) TaxID=412133 RepID=A2FRX9_TRIV3|nr:hypothetical protein TVAGG3_0659490 [Trichomonas vaginalis G3]EAX92345.1 hypothetical protein TVAG_444810 [Trichomonas vaginalis G3]KAI5506404.1 hypothetical protein TVAGG3_0659490 [Trichomonas vaginalis G3]|eukprot:XP_001305275.1 hypothetical protein [Trichomonas vaginalis G3]
MDLNGNQAQQNPKITFSQYISAIKRDISYLYIPFSKQTQFSNEINRADLIGNEILTLHNRSNISKVASYKAILDEILKQIQSYFSQPLEAIISDFVKSNLDEIEATVINLMENKNKTKTTENDYQKSHFSKQIEEIRLLLSNYKSNQDVNDSILMNLNILSGDIQSEFSNQSMNAVKGAFISINNSIECITAPNNIISSSQTYIQEIERLNNQIIDLLNNFVNKQPISAENSEEIETTTENEANTELVNLQKLKDNITKEIDAENREISDMKTEILKNYKEIQEREEYYETFKVPQDTNDIYIEYTQLLSQKKEIQNEIEKIESQKREIEQQLLTSIPISPETRRMQAQNQYYVKLNAAYENFNRKMLWDIQNLNVLTREMMNDGSTVVFNNSQLKNENLKLNQDINSAESGLAFINQQRDEIVNVIEEIYSTEEVETAIFSLISENFDAKNEKTFVSEEIKAFRGRIQSEEDLVKALNNQINENEEKEQKSLKIISNLLENINKKMEELRNSSNSNKVERLQPKELLNRAKFDENSVIFDDLIKLQVKYKKLYFKEDKDNPSDELLKMSEKLYQKTDKLKKSGNLENLKAIKKYFADLEAQRDRIILHATRGAEKQTELAFSENDLEESELNLTLLGLKAENSGYEVKFDQKTLDRIEKARSKMLSTLSDLKLFDDWVNLYVDEDEKKNPLIDKINSLIENS